MKNSTVVIIIIIVLLILIITFTFLPTLITTTLTGQTIIEDKLNEYTYTKAICDKNNYCRDNEIICKGNQTVSVTPITGAVVQFDEDWEDPRDDKTINTLCQ